MGRAAHKLGSHSRMIFPEFSRDTFPPASHLPLGLFYMHFLVADNNPSLSPSVASWTPQHPSKWMEAHGGPGTRFYPRVSAIIDEECSLGVERLQIISGGSEEQQSSRTTGFHTDFHLKIASVTTADDFLFLRWNLYSYKSGNVSLPIKVFSSLSPPLCFQPRRECVRVLADRAPISTRRKKYLFLS